MLLRIGKFAALCFSFSVLLGCADESLLGSLDAPSRESISVTSDYPAVVRVALPGGYGLCTGTFVSPRAVLTAAHCTPTDGTYTVLSSFGIFRTDEVQRMGEGVVNDPNDLSILIFDRDVASVTDVISIGRRPANLERVRLVGYGCNDIERRTGAGTKRTGTNQVYRLSDFIELITPRTSEQVRGILGPSNRAGSCFGDSGGPMLTGEGDSLRVVGVAHAGSWNPSVIRSFYVDLNRWDNLDFINDIDRLYVTGIAEQCANAYSGYNCSNQPAFIQVVTFLKLLWNKLMALF